MRQTPCVPQLFQSDNLISIKQKQLKQRPMGDCLDTVSQTGNDCLHLQSNAVQNRRQAFRIQNQPPPTEPIAAAQQEQNKSQKGKAPIDKAPIDKAPIDKAPIDKASTEASKRFDSMIDAADVDSRLAAAAQAIRENPSQAIRLYEQVARSIIESKDRSVPTMEKHAYAMAQLATLSMQSAGESQTFYSLSKQALKFYQMFEADYFEEIITLLNNMALREEREKNYEDSIKKYLQIIALQNKYMSRKDERKLLTQNNLACLYFECGKKPEGSKIFQILLQQLKASNVSQEVRSLIESNQRYYRRS